MSNEIGKMFMQQIEQTGVPFFFTMSTSSEDAVNTLKENGEILLIENRDDELQHAFRYIQLRDDGTQMNGAATMASLMCNGKTISDFIEEVRSSE